MFHFESKNKCINFLADILYMFTIIYLVHCFDRCGRNNLEYIIVGVILPAIAVAETYYMVATKKFKSLPSITKKRLVGNCILMCVVGIPLVVEAVIANKYYSNNYCFLSLLLFTTALLFARICYIVFVSLQYVVLLCCPNNRDNKVRDIHCISNLTNIIIVIISGVLSYWILFNMYFGPIPHTIMVQSIIALIVILLKHCAIAAWRHRNNL